MTLKKMIFKPGINREVTNYTNEGGWNDGDKVRFRAGFPEKIGGWVQQSFNRFAGACRSLWGWVTLSGQNLTGVGTHEKFYLEYGNEFYDITPLRQQSVGGISFTATANSATLVVNDAAGHGASVGDYVAFRNVPSLSTQEVTVYTTGSGTTPPFFDVGSNPNWVQPTTNARLNWFVGPGGVLPVIINQFNQSGIYANTFYSGVDSPSTPISKFDAANNTDNSFQVLFVFTGFEGNPPVYCERLEETQSTNITIPVRDRLSATSSVFFVGQAGYFTSSVNLPYPLEEGVIYYALDSIGYSTRISLTPGGPALEFEIGGAAVWNWQQGFSKNVINANAGYKIARINSPTEYEIDLGYSAWPEDEVYNGIVIADAVAQYTIPSGAEINEPLTGYGAGGYDGGEYGTGLPGIRELRIWHQSNFGEDLVFGYRGSPLYYWDASSSGSIEERAFPLSDLAGASDVPLLQNKMLVSDTSRFVICFGVNPIGAAVIDPMFIRWSDQENAADWTPTATNQAGDIRLSLGSEIITASQQRQEILVWTDAALYSLQYLGPPYVWGSQLIGENITIMSPNAVASAGNVTYWMGIDKFYRYDGRVQTLRCDVRQYIFENSDPTLNVNLNQRYQVFSGTVEQFDEIWWFYCSSPEGVEPTAPDRYVVYNYAQDIWYYGTLERTAWLDSRTNAVPISAYSNRIILQETGVNDGSDGAASGINAYIRSSEFDVSDGDSYMLITKVLPDMTFRGSTVINPSATLSLTPMDNPGSGYISPASNGGQSSTNVTRTASSPIEEFTQKAYVRVRGRQMVFEVSSSGAGVAWQLGAPRFDMRSDGKRGGRFDA